MIYNKLKNLTAKKYELPNGNRLKLKLNNKIMPKLLNNYDFENSEFTNVNFNNSNLRDTKLHHVDLEKCTFNNSRGNINTSFFSSLINESTFKSSEFEKSDFKKSNIINCDFSSSNLIECDFMGSILLTSLFTNANLKDCHFEYCDLTGCDFTDAKNLHTCSFLMAIYDEEYPPLFNKGNEFILDNLLQKPKNSNLTPDETLGVISGIIDPTTLNKGGKKKKNKSKKKLKKKNKSKKKRKK